MYAKLMKNFENQLKIHTEVLKIKSTNEKYSKEDLNNMRNHPDQTYYLSANIKVGSWTPIGTSENPFKGSFDGQDSANLCQ